MSHSAYPGSTDLEAKLFAAGLFVSPASIPQQMIDLDSAIGGAIEQWEAMTGFTPFLADAAATTHVFTPDGSRVLDLLGGFVTITGVSVNGNAATLNTDYRTMPVNAALKTRPITYLMFDPFNGRFWSLYAPLIGQAGAVSVTGKRGAFVALPDSAWNAILAQACIDLLPDIERLIVDGSIKSWKSGTTEEEYNQKPFAGITAGWQSVIDRALSSSTGNRRMRIA